MPAISVLELVLRGLVIYAALLIALRLFGKREIGQFTLFDLVFVLLVVNALQPAMTGPDASVTGGLILIVTLVAANWVVARLDRLPTFHRMFSPQATVIIRDGKYLRQAMDREGVTEDECQMAIREHGVEKLSEVQLGVLEEDGTISIVPSGSKVHRGRRRIRFLRR